ncbi:unnamed protein product [Acanthoscelides obtectus]|uniref:K Homology domain-containing protein n=1 Tax=Acanthoscelides obtectus TaxID=200917 RepID=A0A9P0LQA6_ACAOB|nr:unnamed protein product [Acanthoscelides obtectus]CAK1649437.1 Activating signal cointegrator 1 complex subunit 1 [Acanthoscelides obtectus]
MINETLPDFFTTKGPIHTNVTPLKFGNSTYWMATITADAPASSQKPSLKPYEDNEEGLIDCEDVEDTYDILLTKSGKFMTSFYVPSSLLAYIIGPKGSKLKSLQRNTNTLIKVPRVNEKGDVKVTGDTERSVASARTQISLIVMQRKDKVPFSHFVSIPVNSEGIKAKFMEFKDDILRDPPRGVTESIFQTPNKLHLTICTLTLLDEEEITAAKKILQNCYNEVITKLLQKNKTYRIIVEGIEIMNDDPSEVNVLYGKVHMSNEADTLKLQEVADRIADYYYKSGLARRQYDKVKLHATLMNTTFRNVEEKQEKIDASDILQKYATYHFGSSPFENIHLSIRFTGRGDYYEPALVLDI